MTQVNSNNNFSEMLFKSSLNQTNEKTQKAEDQGLLALSSVLSSMANTLSTPMKGIIHSSTDIIIHSTTETVRATEIDFSSKLQSHSIATIAKILGAAAAATNKLEAICSKSSSDQTNDMNKISENLIKLADKLPALELQTLLKQVTTTFFGTSDANKGSLNSTTIEEMQESLSKLASTITDIKEGTLTNEQLIQALSSMTSEVNKHQDTTPQAGINEDKSSAPVREDLVSGAEENKKNVEREIARQEAEEKKE